ncbi:MAG: phosphoribosylaminoimidazolesuccinocarboxamide synthase [Spirochaetia bacterium]|nr:phosphoribosylaminoimidazolesuccinocarboxamide synthase [Spirochaetia bacterium]
MQKTQQLYEGKAKKVYETDEKGVYIVSYKDDATAFNGLKKGTIAQKGSINNRVSNHLMQLLEKEGIPTHFLKELSDRETAVRKVRIIPLEVIVRNIAAGSLATRLGLEEGMKLGSTVLEFCYKRDDLGDPLVNEYHIRALGLASDDELAQLSAYSLRINTILGLYLLDLGIELVDFKLEFGITDEGKLILADEISPDTCRFWDTKTGKKLDKDRFRRNLGDVEAAYQEVLFRLMGVN